MSNDKSRHAKSQARSTGQGYATPRLTVHGRMHGLTASGSVAKPENRGHPDRTGRL